MARERLTVPIWDLPVRVGHWLLAGSVALAWITGESETFRLWHAAIGGTALGIALFRIVWGFIGSPPARFSTFVRPPSEAIAYLKALSTGWSNGNIPHYTSHNPAGGYAVLALLAFAIVTPLTGWFTFNEIGREFFEQLHEAVANLFLAVIAIHLAGVAVGSIAHRESLPKAMITGKKLATPDEAITAAYGWGLFPLLLAAGLGAWWAIR